MSTITTTYTVDAQNTLRFEKKISEKPKTFGQKIVSFGERILDGAEALKSNPDGLTKVGTLIKDIRTGYNAFNKNTEYTRTDAFADKFFSALRPLCVFSFFGDIAYHVTKLKGDIGKGNVFKVAFMFTATINDAADTIKFGIELFAQKASSTLASVSSILGQASTALTGVAFIFKGGESLKNLINAVKIPEENKKVRDAAIRQAAFDLAWSFLQVGIAAVTITSLFVVSLANVWIGIPLLVAGAVALTLGSTSIIHGALYKNELEAAEKNPFNNPKKAWIATDEVIDAKTSFADLNELLEEEELEEPNFILNPAFNNVNANNTPSINNNNENN